MSEYAEAYGHCRARVAELIGDAEPDRLRATVPACPEWSVKDLLSHIVGVAKDIEDGNVGDAGRRDWTAAHIEARADRSVAEVLEEWERASKVVEGAMQVIHPAIAAGILGDAIVHEHDLRGALARPGARDSKGVELVTQSYVRFFGRRIKDAGLPAVNVFAGAMELVAGKTEPVASVRAPAFEIMRGLGGRRTIDEIKSFEWEGDTAPYLDIFSMYGIPESSLGE